MKEWLAAFIFTQAVEVPIYLLVMDRQRMPWRPELRVLIAFGASALTHPVVWFVMPKLDVSYWTYVAIAETFAVTGEGIYFHWLGMKRGLLLAFVANALSASLGLLSRYLFGFP
jgi:hypothetical protein